MSQVAHLQALQQQQFPDLQIYSTVSSYPLPTTCDSSALTPDSYSESPEYHHPPELTARYPPPPDTPQQIPTPPGSATMYPHQWPSQAGSPMPQGTNAAQGYADQDAYMSDDRREASVLPPGTYFGHFSVSGGSDSGFYPPPTMHQQHHQQHHHPHHNPHHLEGHPMSLDSHADHQGSVQTMSNHSRAPMHSYPSPRLGSVEGCSAPPGDAAQSANSSPKRRIVQHPKSKKKAAKRSSAAPSSSARGVSTGSDQDVEHTNCLGEFGPPHLLEDTPEQIRHIFELRWNHRDKKGQDMWESIAQDYAKKYPSHAKQSKEMLQMKYKRGRPKHIKWLARDEQLLEQAYAAVEGDRHESILKKFYELGGSRNMQLSASDIEIKLVNDLKLEESVYFEIRPGLNIRRRHKATHRKQSQHNAPRTDQHLTSKGTAEDVTVSQSGPRPTEDEVIEEVLARHNSYPPWDENTAMQHQMMHPRQQQAPQQHVQQRSLPHVGRH
ncbi:hypothetical protein N3K66_005508 [Trichothecium roseum]|uniref:Uncharacterized protein n=1 Tax=Trichothecium roseum TaxID=47278 RepID=A0ACC0UY17_9HYPO|nr:hypothetical protein N3K66_005508 [Trichothecium roseum]